MFLMGQGFKECNLNPLSVTFRYIQVDYIRQNRTSEKERKRKEKGRYSSFVL